MAIMKNTPKNRIAEERKARGMTQQQLADAVGSHWITISKLERGRIKLTTDWLEKLSKPLGVNPSDLLPGTTGPLYGRVLAEPEGYFQTTSKTLFDKERNTRSRVPIQLRIEGSNYEPFLRPGDTVLLVPLRNVEQKQRKDLEGRLCFCDFDTKLSRPGFLYFGKKPNTYDLFWLSRRVAVGARDTKIHLVVSILFGLPPL
jgi:transcriptional regulator with XRE-family HTH domain